jgi:hypothetical protein
LDSPEVGELGIEFSSFLLTKRNDFEALGSEPPTTALLCFYDLRFLLLFMISPALVLLMISLLLALLLIWVLFGFRKPSW